MLIFHNKIYQNHSSRIPRTHFQKFPPFSWRFSEPFLRTSSRKRRGTRWRWRASLLPSGRFSCPPCHVATSRWTYARRTCPSRRQGPRPVDYVITNLRRWGILLSSGEWSSDSGSESETDSAGLVVHDACYYLSIVQYIFYLRYFEALLSGYCRI